MQKLVRHTKEDPYSGCFNFRIALFISRPNFGRDCRALALPARDAFSQQRIYLNLPEAHGLGDKTQRTASNSLFYPLLLSANSRAPQT